ncbi:MAG: hypothetical protein QME60_03640 [Verrucomicrobiota bacterium]|nr:hypothetical protein [Verrucomicrobiota bacterium]
MSEMEIGQVQHYFDKIEVAAIQLTQGDLSVGETIHIVGHTTNVTATVEAMQIEHAAIRKGEKGQVVGLKVPAKVRNHDKVFKVAP